MNPASLPYDAVLIVSFGGPEGRDDVLPFLENVTRGRGVPPARLAEVAEHYYLRDGVSPLNAINRTLRDALAQELEQSGSALPVYWGNRNWHPLLVDVVRQMRDDGVRRVLAFLTSAYSSYSGCRQYLEDLERARAAAGSGAPRIDRVRQYFDHPGFLQPFVRSTCTALNDLPDDDRPAAHLVFTAHSVPTAMSMSSGPAGGAYPTQIATAARIVASEVAATTGAPRPWSVAYQSRSGAPGQPWLEPDVSDHLRELAAGGIRAVVAVPIGFTADHMEVVHDLDVTAADTAATLGMAFARATTPGTDPEFVAMAAELVRERLGSSSARRAGSVLGPGHDECPLTCCPSLRPAS